MLNININAFKDPWLFAEAVIIVVHCFGSAIIFNDLPSFHAERLKSDRLKFQNINLHDG